MAALPDFEEISVSLENIVYECGLVTKERLQQPCPRQFMLTIADKFEDWKTLGYHLGIPSEELKAIGCDNDTESQRIAAMFDAWYEREDSGATYWRLTEALYRWGRRDLLEMLCSRLYKYDKMSEEWSSHIHAYWTPERCAAAEAEEMPNYQPSPSSEPGDDDKQVGDTAFNSRDADHTSEQTRLDTEQTLAGMTAEHRTFLQHTQDIELLIKSHIAIIGGELLSSKLITHSQYEEISEQSKPLEVRATDLVECLQMKVQQDANHYHTFVDVLKRDPEQYSGTLKKLKDTYESFKCITAAEHQPAIESDTPAPPATEGTRLCTKDHSNLYRKLEPYATKWKDIGKALGFKDQELSWILSTPWLVQQAPGSWLGEMLSQWLEWAPGDGRDSRSFATKESLHAALLKANLGNSLADEFQ